MSTDILGRGFAFPLRTDSRGGIRQSAAAQKVEESVRIILRTQDGERVMRPTFGCNLRSLAFAPNNAATANLARHYVEEGLRRWEPRILLDEVTVRNDPLEDRLLIAVAYRIRATYEPGNLVHPFYLQTGAPAPPSPAR
jgi:phage baseplate assembly protein W